MKVIIDCSFAKIIEKFQGLRIALMGDAMEDWYHYGRVERLSPEAPVPVFIQEREETRPGGAVNVANNLTELGVDVQYFYPPAPWTVKHRYIAGHHQLFRIDRDRDHSSYQGEPRPLQAPLDAFIISDYAKGYCSFARCQKFIQAARTLKVPVVVDPKGTKWDKYRGATWICPNESEMVQWSDSALLLKRGAEGLQIISGDAGWNSPSRARQVYDVTGAGDTVVAVFAAALGTGAKAEYAAELANIAASIVVGKMGTSTVTREELLGAL